MTFFDALPSLLPPHAVSIVVRTRVGIVSLYTIGDQVICKL
ncbi:hypothetical protein VCR14J2_260216 [Vibrio coralliirubri]|nr:hypothetical protein VCR3J2_310226 [Vibrio coralliirubri]CDT97784.1 hypothetical protein VCR14J2_260216 [Vibrio coralliirubri]